MCLVCSNKAQNIEPKGSGYVNLLKRCFFVFSHDQERVCLLKERFSLKRPVRAKYEEIFSQNAMIAWNI